MARYIDADKAIAMFKEAQQKTDNIIEITSLIGSMAVIDSCQTEDVAPVVHAHWVKLTSDGHVLGCSNCKYEIYNDIYYPGHLQKYCEECGAKMDERKDYDK